MSEKMKRILVVAQVVLLFVLVLICLSGCGAPAPVLTKIQIERVTIPPALLTCEAEPAVGDWTSQAAVGDYIVQLQEAGADCRSTVWAIAKIETSTPAAAK